MHWKQIAGKIITAALLGSPFFLTRTLPETDFFTVGNLQQIKGLGGEEGEEEEEEERAEFGRERLEHEFRMLRNPITGRIPADYRTMELKIAKMIPSRRVERYPWMSGIAGIEGSNTNNNYVSIGPNNVAGRSRTLAFDRRNTNILISGGTTGGIFRSTNGGADWTFVAPENDIRSVTSIVQDPTAPDTWYCGTGEVYYPTSQADIAGTFGYGIFKSTDNGVTWTKLTATIQNASGAPTSQHRFDNNFDLVHRLAVHPTTGHVYAAIHNRIMRSTDKGATWTTVLGGTQPNNVWGGLTEIYIPANGNRIFAAFSGGGPDSDNLNADRGLAGIWQSTTGAASGWTRIAGGQQGQADSVAGWRPWGRWGRIVLTSNAAGTQLFALYKNGQDAENGDPEADLFRCNLAATLPSSAAWTNLSAWVPDEPNFDANGIDPYTTQFEGFNMSIDVKPNNDNILFIGGTNVHRVNLATTDPALKFRRIGGYGGGFFPGVQTAAIYDSHRNSDDFDPHHPDTHYILHLPGNDNTVYTASDGGIHRSATSDMADTVRWRALTNNLQTLQYQSINIIPDPEASWVIGGAQDNGTHANLNVPADKDHLRIGSGDGASAAMSDFTKTGNNWKQSWYYSTPNGNIFRSNFDWRINNNTLEYVSNTNTEITPNGLNDEGQWLTLFALDPDSTNHLYYTNQNRVFRTKTANAVTSNNWTEITGVRGTVPSTASFSAMALSKLSGRANVNNKRLFLGTNNGKVYRLDSADVKGPTNRPTDITPTTMTAGSYVAGIAVNPRNPDTVMVVVSNYDDASNTINNIFWTGNATAASPTWQVIDGALSPVSSQSCAIVVKTTGVEYYVGTSIGLYSTSAINGISTTWFNEGSGMLKTAIIRSMVVRPEDNTLVIGTHGNGAFYSEIGNPIAYDGSTVVPGGTGFIANVRPTVATGTNPSINYTIGNLTTVTRISVQLFNGLGQQVFREERGYTNGTVYLGNLAAGVYYLRIMSSDGRQKFVQRVIRQ